MLDAGPDLTGEQRAAVIDENC